MDEKNYQKYSKKYKSLPSFELLNNEFEIRSIDKKDFLLREIRRKITDRIETFIKFIEDILQPEGTNFSLMYECLCFSDAEKKELLNLFKKMMILQRSLVLADISLDEKQDVEIIILAAKEWPQLRKNTIPYVEKIKNHWHELKETKEILDYLR